MCHTCIPKDSYQCWLSDLCFTPLSCSLCSTLLIPSNLQVNSNQTQVIYQQSSALTYKRKGSCQISTIGLDKKQAFTLNVAISASGALLPFQAIFKGKTMASLPTANSLCYNEADQLSFLFEFSGTDNYWANIKIMKSFVTLILVPYFITEKECLWQLKFGLFTHHSHFRLGCLTTILGLFLIMSLEDVWVFGNPEMLVFNIVIGKRTSPDRKCYSPLIQCFTTEWTVEALCALPVWSKGLDYVYCLL